MTFDEFQAKHDLCLLAYYRVKYLPNRTDVWEADYWIVSIGKAVSPCKVYTTTYSKGTGLRTKGKPVKPTLREVLESLQSDVRDTDRCFEDWAAFLGYDEDSRKAEAIYKACQGVAQGLLALGVLRDLLTVEF